MSQKEVSLLVRRQRQQISLIETGKCDSPLNTVANYARVFDLSISELLRRAEILCVDERMEDL
jgi:DNA-binding XRE family transcriptional regulator